jgi:hypothetical protein
MSGQADIVGLVRAVTAGLNAGSDGEAFSKQFNADYEWDPEVDVEELANVKVTVSAVRRRSRRLSRKQWEHDYDVDVLVQQRTDGSKEDIENKLKLPEELAVYFDGAGLDFAADFLDSSVGPYLDREHLRQKSVVSSLVTLTFRMWP